MTCTFCGSRQQEGETRCRLCGRRPTDTLTRDFNLIGTQGALATQTHALIHPPVVDETASRPIGRAVQRMLFPDRDSKIVPFETYAPEPSKPARSSRPRTAKPKTAATGEIKTPVRRRKGVSELQA